MVYELRRGYSRYGSGISRAGSIRKKALTRRPTAGNQKQQIVALAGEVQKLGKRQRLGSQISQYQYLYEANLTSDYNVFDVVVPTSWVNIFADPDAVENATRITMKHIKFDMLFTCNTERAPVTFSCFLVTLKPDTADQVLSVAGSNLGLMSAGAHYAKAGTYSGLVHLNEQFFTIRKQWRFTVTTEMLSTHTEASREASTSYKRISFNFPYSRSLHSGRNSWRTALNSDRVASSAKLFLLMFNDNSSLDLENPKATVNAVIKVESF